MNAEANMGAVLALLEAGFPDYAMAVLMHRHLELPWKEQAARVEIRRIVLAGDTVEAIQAIRAHLAAGQLQEAAHA